MSTKPNPTDPRVERQRTVARMMNPATYAIDPEALTSARAVGDALTKLRSAGVNLLGPEVHLSSLPRLHVVSLRFALIDPYDPPMTASGEGGKRSNGLWYDQNGGGVSLHWAALNQLARVCGVRWESFRRTDAGMTPLYWRFEGSATMKLLDGSICSVHGTGESDLRDSSAEIKGISQKRLDGMRAKGSQRAESIAKARILRELLCVRQKYTEDEAAQPFVFPALEFRQPDDPELDRILALREMGVLGDIYGGRREVIDVSPVAAPRALPAPADGVDFAAENARLADRERVPVHADPDADADELGEDEGLPWDPPAPASDDWSGYTTAQVRDFLKAGDRPDPSKEGPERQAQIRAWLATEAGKAKIDAFLAATAKRGGA